MNLQILPAKNRRKPWRMEAIELEPPPGYVGARIMLSEPDVPDDPIVKPFVDKRKAKPDTNEFKRFREMVLARTGYYSQGDFNEEFPYASSYLIRMHKRKQIINTGRKTKSKVGGRPSWLYKNYPVKA